MVIKALYLLVGKEDFLKKEFIQNLQKSLFPKSQGLELNYQEFYAKEQPLSAVTGFLQTMPFLSEKRLALLWDIDDLPADEKDTLLVYAENPSPTGVLVLLSGESSAKKNSFLRELSTKASLVNCYTPFDRDLPPWIENHAKKLGKRIDRESISFLIEQRGSDLNQLHSALEQLALYIHPKDQITAKDVKALLGKSVEADVFSLVDTLLDKNAALSLEIVGTLLREGTRAFEIVATLAAQFDRLRKAGVLIREGASDETIGAELKVNSFYLKKFTRQARKVSGEEMAEIFRRLLNCDEAIKTSRLSDKMTLERLVIEFCLDRKAAPVGQF